MGSVDLISFDHDPDRFEQRETMPAAGFNDTLTRRVRLLEGRGYRRLDIFRSSQKASREPVGVGAPITACLRR